MSKILEKVIAVILIIILTSANIILLGEYTIAYALSDEELIKQDSSTNNKNVEFNSYFYGETHNQVFSLESEDAKIYLRIKVNNAGYLQNGVIEFQNTNFKLKEGISNENIQSIDYQNNKIILNRINNGSDITIELPIEILKDDNVSLDYFNKETLTKFTATYVDGNGKEKQIEKKVTNKLSWKGNGEIELTASANKFVTYNENENYGVMLQTKVNSKLKDSSLPIHNTNIEITVPTINNTKPNIVNVIAINTLATNGKADGLEFNSNNYYYDIENGKVTINVSNLEDSISWKKNVSDEYLVTYLFEGQEVYNFAKQNGISSEILINSESTVYNNEEIKVNKNIKAPISFTSEEGNITDFSVNVPEKISKGYIYANYDAKDKKETEYLVNYVATINSAKLTNSLELVQAYDKFVTSENKEGSTTVGNNNYAYNKRVEVSQAEFNKILGENGTITIKNEKSETLGIINKETKLENGIYSLDISEKNNNKLDIVTSAPITEGQLKINVVKAIKGNIDYSKEQMKSFTKMKIELEGKTNLSVNKASKEMLLAEPVTKTELSINKENLTTVVENKNVEIRAVLDTSNEYNALFENTTLKIILPSYIENIDLNSVNILLDNGLKIKNSQVKDENGQKVIYVELEGKQTEYTIDAEYKGAIVVLNTDINVKTLTPSSSAKITMEYTNKNETATNLKGTEEQQINFVAPSGIVAASGISNYKEEGEDVLSISDEPQTVGVEPYSEKRIATMKGIVINNYQNDISNISILGRIPAQGNKKIDTETELGSTFTIPLAENITITEIDSSNYTIYYSDNANATKDLDEPNNGWQKTMTANSKAFLIVFNSEYKLQNGDKFNFSYNIEIPENLAPNNNSYSMYKVYYTNNSQIGSMEESKNSAIIGLTTGKGPELEVELSSTVDTIKEGQIVKMKATIKNIGEVDAEDAKIIIPLPEYSKFINYIEGNGFIEDNIKSKEIAVGTIKSGETIKKDYYIKIIDYIEETTLPKEITNVANLKVKGLNNVITSNKCILNVENGEISLSLVSDTDEELVLVEGQVIEYLINIHNISGKENIDNVVITVALPKGLKYVEATIKNSWEEESGITEGINFNEEDNLLTINLEKIEYYKVINLKLEVKDFEGNISLIAKAVANNIEHYSNISEYIAEKINLQISELTSTPKYIKEGNIVTYNINLTNNGKTVIKNIRILDTLPNELYFEKATYIYAGEEQVVNTLTNGNVDISINRLEVGESIEVKVMAKARLLENKEDKEIKNKMTITAKNFEKIETNIVSNIIEYNSDIHDNESGEDDNKENRYKITGTAWIDENKDGKRDNTEQILPNIQVILLNKDGKSIVKDVDTNENKITTTNSNGEYEFNNLLNGEYLVLFIYDSSNYTLTEYQKSGVDSSYNSDAIDINMIFNGEKRIVGITDIITIDGENVRDIDIGVYTASKFDLRLDKYINKITLTTPTIGTRVDSYNNSKLGKVEVLGQNLGKSNAVIEYKIVIKNEGSVPGYVNKIVDYLPENVSFTTELNRDWYLSENGNIYNASLTNEKIEPGETKEVTLIVSMKIEEKNLGIITNNAEIYESYNEQGLKDIDSTEGNKEESEDDISKAEVIVSIVTGKIIMYTLIGLVIILMLALGVYGIKKYVLNNKKI